MIELLSNTDLLHLSKTFNITLNKYITFKDFYSKIKPQLGNYIFNLQSYSAINQGTHWCCFIIRKNVAIYYDAFGMSPPIEVVTFIKRYNKNIKIIYSSDDIQHMDSILCGYFCLFFIYFFNVIHKNSKNYRKIINLHNNIFSKEERQNDEILQRLFSNMFLNIK